MNDKKGVAAGASEPKEATPVVIEKPKNRGEMARDNIYEARSKQLIDERNAIDDMDPEDQAQINTLVKQGVGQMLDDIDDIDDSDDLDSKPGGEAGKEPESKSGTKPATIESMVKDLASGADAVTIRSYGEERAVTREAVLEAAGLVLLDKQVSDEKRLEAGLRELSKHNAADVRLRQAKDYENRLRSWYEDVKKQTSGSPATTPPATGAQDPVRTVPTPAPSQLPEGAGEKELRERASEIVSALYAGEREEAESAMTALLTSLGSGKQLDVDTLKKEIRTELVSEMHREQEHAKEEDANTVFASEFPDIEADDVLFAAAQARAIQLRNDPEWSGRPLADIAREAGQYVTNLFSIKPAVSGVDAELKARRSLKEVRPKPLRARARQLSDSLQEGDEEPSKFPSSSDYIRSLNRQRTGKS